jgi:hypothetical protein
MQVLYLVVPQVDQIMFLEQDQSQLQVVQRFGLIEVMMAL